MDNNRTAKRKILLKAYVRIALVNMMVLITTNIIGFIDNAIISKTLGNGALAAIGYFYPISTITGLAFLIIGGTGILCGSFIGSGQQHKVNALFTASFITISVFCMIMALVITLFRFPLGTLLGAGGEAYSMLVDYMLGFAPSIVFSALNSFLITLAVFNNEIRKTYIATVVMFVVHIGAVLLLVGPLGTFGIGLSVTLSSLVSLLIVLPIYMKKSSTIHFAKCKFEWPLLLEAAKRGSPNIFFTAGMLAKASFMNISLIAYAGDSGIAAVNVMNSICGVVGTLAGGFINSHSSLGSLTYGEEDREGYIDLFHLASWLSAVCCCIMVAVMAIFSSQLSAMFFGRDTEAYEIGKVMLRIGFWFFIINIFFNIILNSYKVQGRMWLVNFIVFIENFLTGVITLTTIPAFGVNAAWLASLWSNIIVLAIILVSVFVWRKRFSLSAASILKLPDDYGASKDQYVEYKVESLDDVSAVSESVVNFCKGRGADSKKSFYAGLCIEEITRNILQHGKFHERSSLVDVRVVCTDEMTIRVSDDCQKFDPREIIKMYNPEMPEKNIGLRMVAKLANSIDYYNNAGINTLIMKL